MGNIVGLIPARAGSKGVPNKNVKLLAGKPLIAYTIEAALAVARLERVIVSTDSEAIAETAREFGAEARLRPAALATDTAPVLDTAIHLLDALAAENDPAQALTLLQPTSPLRSAASIRGALEAFASAGGDSVVSVRRCREPLEWVRSQDPEGVLHSLEPLLSPKRRQDQPQRWVLDGSIYVSSVENLRRRGSFHSEKTRAWNTPEGEALDIDTPEDWEYAEFLMARRAKAGV